MIDIQIGSFKEAQILFLYEDADHTSLPVQKMFRAEFLEAFRSGRIPA